MLPEEICRLIERHRIDTSTEDAAQRAIASILEKSGIGFEAEVILAKDSRIDFLVGTVGVEVKIRSTRREILRQLDRYAEFDRITGLVLATSTSFPSRGFIAREKPVLIASLSMGWL